MDIKKLLIGGITGGILLFLLGWLVYGNLLAEFMKNHPGTATGVDRTEMDFMFLALGNLAMGFLLTYVLIRANVTTLSNGLVTAGVVGMLLAISVDSVMYATTNIASKKMILADVIGSTVMNAITGAVIGLVLGKLAKSS